MAYIMFLNPIILKDGFDFHGVYTATILASAIACFIYGSVWKNLGQ